MLKKYTPQLLGCLIIAANTNIYDIRGCVLVKIDIINQQFSVQHFVLLLVQYNLQTIHPTTSNPSNSINALSSTVTDVTLLFGEPIQHHSIKSAN